MFETKNLLLETNQMVFKSYAQYSQIIKFDELRSPDRTWILLESIGEGTYGEVFKARNLQTGQLAAVKVMESVNEVIEEIEEEYLVLNELCTHANLPKFYGIFMKRNNHDEDQLWLVLELCSNGSVTDLVKSLIRRGLKLDETIIAYILKHTCLALQHLHRNNVMHRDVKGHNILITENGNIKLIDFGVSAHVKYAGGRRNTSVGTPFWMSPEVIACEQQMEYDYDVKCDIWSLGITAIELADGEPPLSDLHPMRALFKIPRNPPPTLGSPKDWSDSYNSFVKKCLIKDFEKRPSIDELLKHPFLAQIPENNGIEVHKEKLRNLVQEQRKYMRDLSKMPEVTTKHGKFKSKRKSKRHSPHTVDDLASLENFDEDSIVTQLFNRFMQGQIYTYIGDILLAVNPFSHLNMYTDEWSKKYQNALKNENPPHIFAVADFTYRAMMHNYANQCIIISGESGSGKTESANFLLQQLTILGRAPTKCLEEKILQVNPLMEAFGNAKTIINDNSSRFGKYLDLIFTRNGRVIGAQLHEYLLEKSRVVSQSQGERNFHIFYYMYDGLTSDTQKSKYHLSHDTKYKYLNDIDSTQSKANRQKFATIHQCFETIGFKSQEVNSIYSLLAGVLHLGNLNFTQDEGIHNDGKCVIVNKSSLSIISQLFGVDEKELQDALTHCSIVTRGETVIKSNSLQECSSARDAMSKGLYGRLFSWIVNKINLLLQPALYESQDTSSISLLDIFGFENFSKNSFEQICINIANEQIQYYFNQHVFAWEMQEYLNEGIDGSEIVFVDNRPVLDMFLAKPMGLLALLDEESRFPKATDATLVEKFHRNIKTSFYSKPKSNDLVFTIQHYAGQVQYDVTGFLEKNCDYVPPEIICLLRQSEISLIRSLFRNSLTKTGEHPPNIMTLCTLAYGTMKTNGSLESYESSSNSNVKYVRPSGSSNKSSTTSQSRAQATVSTYFRYSLMDLLSKMVAGAPHFVRCIRPNKDKIPGYFDAETVQTQLKYTGVLETTKIRRLGFSHRLSYSDFVKRYSLLLNPLKNHCLPLTKESCVEILLKIGLKNWKLGKTKIFLKYYHIEHLSRLYDEIQSKIVLVQSLVRAWLAKRLYRQQKEISTRAALIIQKFYRNYKAKKQFKLNFTKTKAIIRLQSHVRAFLAREKFKSQLRHKKFHEKMLDSIIRIQSCFRGYRARRRYKNYLIEKTAKSMQLGYFSQQVQLLANDVYMWMIKSNYRVDPRDLHTFNRAISSCSIVSPASIQQQQQQQQQRDNLPLTRSSNSFNINEDIVNKIKKSLEQKASIINNNRQNEKAQMKQSYAQRNGSNQKSSSSSSTNTSQQRSYLINPSSNNYDSLIACQQPTRNRILSRSNSNLNITNYGVTTSSLGSSIVAVNLAVLNQNISANGHLIDESRLDRNVSFANSNDLNMVCELYNNSRRKFHSPSERKNTRNGSLESDSTIETDEFDDQSPKFNFRALLRKTGQDLTNGTTLSRKNNLLETRQIDFRNVLRNRMNKQTIEQCKLMQRLVPSH